MKISGLMCGTLPLAQVPALADQNFANPPDAQPDPARLGAARTLKPEERTRMANLLGVPDDELEEHAPKAF